MGGKPLEKKEVLLSDIQIQAYNALNESRNIEHFVNMPLVQRAFNLATDEWKEELVQVVQDGKKSKADKWLKKISEKHLELLTMRELFSIASRLSIPYYANLPKDELIFQIEEERAK